MAGTTGLNIKDFRGLRGLVIAPLVSDTSEGIEWGTVTPFAGAEGIANEVNESTATKHYDNKAAIVTAAEGEDSYSITCSVVDDTVKAITEGRKVDQTTGAYIGTPLKRPYCALGFIGKDTDGKEYGVWIYKCKLTGGGESYNTENDGTDSSGMEYTATSIYTEHVFEKADNKPVKFMKVPLDKVDETTFFATVVDPDTVAAKDPS